MSKRPDWKPPGKLKQYCVFAVLLPVYIPPGSDSSLDPHDAQTRRERTDRELAAAPRRLPNQALLALSGQTQN
jgi:hypothetical protein